MSAALRGALVDHRYSAHMHVYMHAYALRHQAMTAVLPLRGALLASGVLFGAQHMQASHSYLVITPTPYGVLPAPRAVTSLPCTCRRAIGITPYPAQRVSIFCLFVQHW